MIESRCGICCSVCTYREAAGCPGCTQMEHPFWGVCPLKTCTEGKRLHHCGECDRFPCETLQDFAYDKEHGEGDGSRIEQCRRWAAATPRLRCTLLVVGDMARAKAFYTGVLGLSVVEDLGANVTLEGGIALQEKSVWRELIAGGEVTLGHNAAELYFEVEDIDAFAAALPEETTVFQTMHEAPYGQRLLRLADPDGNLVEIGEAMDAVCRRMVERCGTVAAAAARMAVPPAYVEACLRQEGREA